VARFHDGRVLLFVGEFWLGGPEKGTAFMGFDLTPESEVDAPTRGVQFFASP